MKVLLKNKRRCRLKNCPIGLFIYDDELCIKTEYGCGYCYIISTGEIFRGGIDNRSKLSQLLVYPVKITNIYDTRDDDERFQI